MTADDVNRGATSGSRGLVVSGNFEGRYEGTYTDGHPFGHAERFVLRILEGRITEGRLAEVSPEIEHDGPRCRLPVLKDVRISTIAPQQAHGDLPFLESLRDVTILAPELDGVYRDGSLVRGMLRGRVIAWLHDPSSPSETPSAEQSPTDTRVSTTTPVAVSAPAGDAHVRRLPLRAAQEYAGRAQWRYKPAEQATGAGCLIAAGIVLVLCTLATLASWSAEALARHPALLSIGVPLIALAIVALLLAPLPADPVPRATPSTPERLLRIGVALLAWGVLAFACGAPLWVLATGMSVLALCGALMFWTPPALNLGDRSGRTVFGWDIPAAPVQKAFARADGAGRLLAICCLTSALGAAALTYVTGLHHYWISFVGLLPITLILVPLAWALAAGIGGSPGAVIALGSTAAAFIVPAQLQGSSLLAASMSGSALMAAGVSSVVTLVGLGLPPVRARPRLLAVSATLLPLLGTFLIGLRHGA